jgi:hypothetical protein
VGPDQQARGPNGYQSHASFTRDQTSASPSNIQAGSRMRECRTSGSVRGVLSNGHPYRNPLKVTKSVAEASSVAP